MGESGITHYHLRMPNLRVQIVRFVDEEPQPGIVESRFRDAHGVIHTIIDKVPIFTTAALWSDSEYPQPGIARCEVLERLLSPQGDPVARVSIAHPDGLEAVTGQTEFVMPEPDVSL